MMTLTEIELEHIDDVWYQEEMNAEQYSWFLAYDEVMPNE